MAAGKEKEKTKVYIRKLIANYELRYGYAPMINAFIKNLPKEHRSVKVEAVIDEKGNPKESWVRIIKEGSIDKVIAFLLDNSFEFVLENLLEEEIKALRQRYIERQRRLAEILRLKNDSLTVGDEDYSFMKIEPYDYQKQAIKFFEINEGVGILGDEPGAGKSCPVIAYASKHKLRTLVICPASLKLNWRKEILEFSHDKPYVYKFIPPKRSKMQAYTKEESLFHIINYEGVESFIKLEYKHKCSGSILSGAKGTTKCGYEETSLNKKIKECPNCKNVGTIKSRVLGVQFFSDKADCVLDPEDYDLIVLDEFHRIKEKDTSWTQIIIRAFTEPVPKKILLSGTAIKSRPMELFTPLSFINPKEWNNKHEYGIQYCAGFESNFGWDYSGASNLEELFERISGVFLRRLKKDVLKSLPEKTYTRIPIELTTQERKKYEDILKAKTFNEKGETEEEKYLSKIHKLKKFLGEVKATRAQEIINDIIENGDKVVVMSDYQDVAASIFEANKPHSVLHTGSMNEIDRHNSVENFQKNKSIKVFSGMIGASGVGITLTAANTLIFNGFAWTPGDMTQCADRIHRASSTASHVSIIYLYCADTIDEDIMELLDNKERVVNKVLDNTTETSKAKTLESDMSILKDIIARLK